MRNVNRVSNSWKIGVKGYAFGDLTYLGLYKILLLMSLRSIFVMEKTKITVGVLFSDSIVNLSIVYFYFLLTYTVLFNGHFCSLQTNFEASKLLTSTIIFYWKFFISFRSIYFMVNTKITLHALFSTLPTIFINPYTDLLYLNYPTKNSSLNGLGGKLFMCIIEHRHLRMMLIVSV